MTSNPPIDRETRRVAWWLLAVTLAAVLFTYARTLGFDLIWDDYVALRPRSAAELWGVWHGSWDPRHIWPVFYRPLSVWYYAGAFELFGYSARWLHLLSLVEVTIASWLLGWFVYRESHSRGVAFLAGVTLSVHPGLAHSAAPFFFLQNHLISIIIVAIALLGWQSCRHERSWTSWWPIWLATGIGFLVKEDVLMIAPAVIAAQVLRAVFVRDLPKPSQSVVIATVVFCAGLFALRYAMLGQLGGVDDLPGIAAATRNVLRAPFRVFVEFRGVFFENRPLYRAASVASIAWLSIGSVGVLRSRAPRAMALWITGATLVVCFAIPLGVMSMMWRYHLVTLGGAILLAGAADGCFAWVRGDTAGSGLVRERARVLVGAAIAAVLVMFAFTSRTIIAPFTPCGYGTLSADQEIGDWDLSPAITAWLAAKPEACRNGTYTPGPR